MSNTTKTHWRKLHNPDYLGAYSLEPGKDLVVKIKSVANEMVTGTDGKKEECMVAHLYNNKPMIINATNAKTISKVLNSPYIEDWADKYIQLFVDHVKAFGEIVEALRVRPFAPKIQSQTTGEKIICEDCKNVITPYGKMDAAQLAQYTKQKYDKKLCAGCASKQAASESAEPAGQEPAGQEPVEQENAGQEPAEAVESENIEQTEMTEPAEQEPDNNEDGGNE